eukprot:TRINITY_DN11285_c0_g1_i2.p1 TRINITY_DN11285_c0_g1~~TRINITY_DN11285_c0_g1_i2.p1  ORF type:complete len:764 (-),score=69.38 TRINITY_DN11285_c0_g1_i2:638-2929(-)
MMASAGGAQWLSGNASSVLCQQIATCKVVGLKTQAHLWSYGSAEMNPIWGQRKGSVGALVCQYSMPLDPILTSSFESGVVLYLALGKSPLLGVSVFGCNSRGGQAYAVRKRPRASFTSLSNSADVLQVTVLEGHIKGPTCSPDFENEDTGDGIVQDSESDKPRLSESKDPQLITKEKDDNRADYNVGSAPLLAALTQQASSGDATFHFPGHKRGAGAPPKFLSAMGLKFLQHDLPELPELDNLFAPEAAILEAQEQAAQVFGAGKTFFLVNGSTVGIQAAIMATCPEGKALVLPRNAHQCAVSGMVLSGASALYYQPDYRTEWGIAGAVDPETIRDVLETVNGRNPGLLSLALSEGSKARLNPSIAEKEQSGKEEVKGEAEDKLKQLSIGAVLVISPTYHGACSDIQSIADICHAYNVPLIVDEAHGGHFGFHSELPLTALQQGADVAVQSTHKVLGSLTQSAMLHISKSGRVDQSRVAKCLQALQSSSPSYLLLSSLDAATAQVMSPAGKLLLDRAISLSHEARQALESIPGVKVMDWQQKSTSAASTNDLLSPSKPSVVAWDPLRITVATPGLGLSGYEVDDLLRIDFGVVAELPSQESLTFALSAGTTEVDVTRLVDAYKALSATHSPASLSFLSPSSEVTDSSSPPQNKGALSGAVSSAPPEALPARWLSPASWIPRDAFFADSVRLPTDKAVGCLSAELLCPYPPGIPVLAPGELLTEDIVCYLRALLSEGASISGASDPSLETIAVIKSTNWPNGGS